MRRENLEIFMYYFFLFHFKYTYSGLTWVSFKHKFIFKN